MWKSKTCLEISNVNILQNPQKLEYFESLNICWKLASKYFQKIFINPFISCLFLRNFHSRNIKILDFDTFGPKIRNNGNILNP